ncbi:MAG: hypothetical protein AABX98_02680, partial [Nanoarchaeota archaeon]
VLANRPLGYKPENAKPFRSLIPISELLAQFHGKAVATKKVWEEYRKLVTDKQSEYDVLLKMPIDDIAKATSSEFAEIMVRNRAGKINVKGGYDGVYGIPLLNEKAEQNYQEEHQSMMASMKKKQSGLQEFFG